MCDRRSRHRQRSQGLLSVASTATGWVFASDRRGARNLAIGQLFTALSALAVVAASALLFKGILRGARYGSLTVLGPLFAFALVSGISNLVTTVSTQRQRLMGERVEQDIWRRVLRRVEAANLITYESDGFATHLARVQQNAVSRPLPTVRAVFTLIGALLTAVFVGAALCSFSLYLPIILLVSAVPSVVIGRAAGRIEFGFAKRVLPLYMRRNYLRYTITRREHAAELRASEAIGLLTRRHEIINGDLLGQLRRQIRRRTTMAVATSAASSISLICALTGIVVLVDSHRLTLAQAGAAAIAARLFGSALTNAYTAYSTLAEAAPHLADLDDFLAVPVKNGVTHNPKPLQTALVLEGVSFQYPSRTTPALSGADVTIRRGEVVALVGENGSGKSTLARLVAGLYEPDAGTITWDGATLESRERIASTSLLTQDFGHYAFTVAENISLGDSRIEPSAANVEMASAKANFHPIAASLDDGYASMLGRELDEGIDLSGGQWQRLALARALFRGGDLLILDEPSSALDPRAESELFDDVRRVLEGRSALLISHRYSSVRLADRIYVLHQGTIVEQGTHLELMTLGGRYAELFRLQSASFLAGIAGFD